MNIDKMIQEVTTSLIAIVLIAGTLAIISYQVMNGKPVTVPDVLIALDFAVGGLYFGKVASVNGARQAGAAAAQTAIAQVRAASEVTPSVPPSS